MNTEQLIDVTDILAQPREFAQRLARVERERAELIETVARLRAECNDAQAVARAYILRAERADATLVAVDAVIERYTHPVLQSQMVNMIAALRAALRQPALARQISTSDGVTWHTFGGNTPPEQVVKPAPAGGEARP